MIIKIISTITGLLAAGLILGCFDQGVQIPQVTLQASRMNFIVGQRVFKDGHRTDVS